MSGMSNNSGLNHGLLMLTRSISPLALRLDLASFWLSGSGEAGLLDGGAAEARFDEPGGLSAAGGKLYVADTNNHLIRVVQEGDGSVSTFELKDPHKLAIRRRSATRLPTVGLGSGGKLKLNVGLPAGMKLNPAAPSQVEVSQDGHLQAFSYEGQPLDIALTPGEKVRIETSIYYCEEGREGLCLYDMGIYEAAIEQEGEGELFISV